jgi:hypothetical protein
VHLGRRDDLYRLLRLLLLLLRLIASRPTAAPPTMPAPIAAIMEAAAAPATAAGILAAIVAFVTVEALILILLPVVTPSPTGVRRAAWLFGSAADRRERAVHALWRARGRRLEFVGAPAFAFIRPSLHELRSLARRRRRRR